MRAPDFDIDQLINDLNGSSQSLEESLKSLYPEMEWGDLTQEDLQTIDIQIFECQECNWWCENSEMEENDLGEQICDDCYRAGY